MPAATPNTLAVMARMSVMVFGERLAGQAAGRKVGRTLELCVTFSATTGCTSSSHSSAFMAGAGMVSVVGERSADGVSAAWVARGTAREQHARGMRTLLDDVLALTAARVCSLPLLHGDAGPARLLRRLGLGLGLARRPAPRAPARIMLAGPPPSAFAVINGAAAAAAGSGSSSARPAPDAAATAGSAAQLARWNVQANRLPDPARIKAVHVYDFDNTLFATPLPNRKIWSNESLARLAELSYFSHGGWWHDARILAATGKGVDAEEPVAWKGWWNENIVKLVQLSMEQKDALTVLLTGRSAKKFAPLIQRMVGARKLEFDLFVLKPDADQYGNPWKSTLACKEAFLGELLDYYREAEEFRIYEDRVKHVRAFEDFSKSYVDALRPGSRLPLNMEVIQVAELGTTLDPATELAEVQTMVDSHNTIVASEKHRAPGILHLRRTVFYTGDLVPQYWHLVPVPLSVG